MKALQMVLQFFGLAPDEYERGYRAAIAAAQAAYGDVAPTFVPGMWRCAKCKVELYVPRRRASEPQPCMNGCGPMWRVTEDEYRRELHRFVNASWRVPAGWYCLIDNTPILRLQAGMPIDGKRWFPMYRPPTPDEMHAVEADRIIPARELIERLHETTRQ